MDQLQYHVQMMENLSLLPQHVSVSVLKYIFFYLTQHIGSVISAVNDILMYFGNLFYFLQM